jgi:hypothetical protein
VCTFLADVGNIKILCAGLAARGNSGLVGMLKALSVPVFAEWRWTTLADACLAIESVWTSLRANFDVTLFKQSRSQTRFGKVTITRRMFYGAGFVFQNHHDAIIAPCTFFRNPAFWMPHADAGSCFCSISCCQRRPCGHIMGHED